MQQNEYGYINQKGNRYFWKVGATTRFNSGFISKSQVKDWIKEQGAIRGIDWQVGFSIKYKDSNKIYILVDRDLKEVKY